MNNPFKAGDKVVRRHYEHGGVRVGGVAEVAYANVQGVRLVGGLPGWVHKPTNLRAAIAGQDYDVQPGDNTGHLPDGSSVQKHSAGPIYPCVITLRDARLKGTTLFDYGLTSPRNRDHIWFSTLEAAHAVADIIKKDIAS